MNDYLTLSQIKDRLADRTLTVVQEKTGLSYGTLEALKRGDQRRYNLGTLKIISDYLTS